MKKKIHLLLHLVPINSNLKIRNRDGIGFFVKKELSLIGTCLIKHQKSFLNSDKGVIIFLTGAPGSGKSTLAQMLGKHHGNSHTFLKFCQWLICTHITGTWNIKIFKVKFLIWTSHTVPSLVWLFEILIISLKHNFFI